MDNGGRKPGAPFVVPKKQVLKTYRLKSGYCHIYTDASFNLFHKIGTYGAVIITEDNWFYKSGQLKDVTCITDCETKAILNAVFFLKEKLDSKEISHFDNLRVYSDSAQAIRHLGFVENNNPDERFFYLKEWFQSFQKQSNFKVEFFKVKAHTENNSVISVINGFCDQLAKAEIAMAIAEKSKPKLKIETSTTGVYAILELIQANNWEEVEPMFDSCVAGMYDNQIKLILNKAIGCKAPDSLIEKIQSYVKNEITSETDFTEQQ